MALSVRECPYPAKNQRFHLPLIFPGPVFPSIAPIEFRVEWTGAADPSEKREYFKDV